MIPKLDCYKKSVGISSLNEIKPGLESIEAAMDALGSPQSQIRAIHVAGTNGKGSTIAFMESILHEAGYTTGVFASPAMIDIHDQIRLNGQNIATNELLKSFQTLKDAGLNGQLTDFELLTAAAFVTFNRLQPDIALIECGMGGRFDSTNVLLPLVSIIPSIAKDHTGFLGETIKEIAWHKAGIIKAGIPVICGQLSDDAKEVVRQIATEQDSPLQLYGENFEMEEGDIEYYNGLRSIEISERAMKGPHQGINAAVAIEALIATEYPMSTEAIQRGIAKTQLAYRFEQVAPNIYFDGAHNPAAAKMLARTIQQQFPNDPVDFIIGMMANKDIKKTLDELIPVARSFMFVDFNTPGAASAAYLYEMCDFDNKIVIDFENVSVILRDKSIGKKIVSGSLYLLNNLKFHVL